MIQLHDKKFEIFIAEEEINFALEAMAKQIEADFFEERTPFTMYCCKPNMEVKMETTREVSPYFTVRMMMPLVWYGLPILIL